MQNTQENLQRGENAPINFIDELAFHRTPPAEEVVQTTTEEQELSIENLMADTQGQLSNLIEGMMKEMRDTHNEIVADADTSEVQRAASLAVIDSINLVENHQPVVDFMPMNQQINTIAFMKETLKRFRSMTRRFRISKLDALELIDGIRNMKDVQRRQKLIIMVNTVMLFAMKDPAIFRERAVFLRFQFLVLKYAIKLSYMPVLASVLHERYREAFQHRQ
jgi:hypothetical protein